VDVIGRGEYWVMGVVVDVVVGCDRVEVAVVEAAVDDLLVEDVICCRFPGTGSGIRAALG
jgi:hypothetical protein